MTFKVFMATHNRGKVAELKSLLEDVSIQVLTLEDFPSLAEIEETGTTFLENALQKAKMAAEASGYISLGDDSGLVVDALGGQPGVYSARFAGESCNDQENNLKLLRLLKGVPFSQRTARFVSVIALVTPQGQVYTAAGRCEGIILEKLRGTGGFGYDPLFYLPELGKTMAELTLAEKNMVSHRGKAWREIIPFLQTIFQETER
jgi:XTP/dITP diphosphohydrolase